VPSKAPAQAAYVPAAPDPLSGAQSICAVTAENPVYQNVNRQATACCDVFTISKFSPVAVTLSLDCRMFGWITCPHNEQAEKNRSRRFMQGLYQSERLNQKAQPTVVMGGLPQIVCTEFRADFNFQTSPTRELYHRLKREGKRKIRFLIIIETRHDTA